MDRKTIVLGLAGLTAATAAAIYFYNKMSESKEDKPLKNSAFVFIKPHANNTKTQELVRTTLASKGIEVVTEGEFTGEQIDQGMLIDQHYYAIASKATILKPSEIPVPAEKFQEKFGLSWDEALASGKVFNAKGACEFLGIDATALDALWGKCDKVKFGGGFYCGKLDTEKGELYTFNAFFMEMRSKFVTPGTSIHYYVVEFDPSVLAWADFRGSVLGPTDPAKAPAGSLRNMMLMDWQNLGMEYEPNVGDNCVHASASPFEGLAERMNWMQVAAENDSFGARALAAGISAETLKAWSVDPQVKGKSIFDQLEDMDAAECLAKMVELSQ